MIAPGRRFVAAAFDALLSDHLMIDKTAIHFSRAPISFRFCSVAIEDPRLHASDGGADKPATKRIFAGKDEDSPFFCSSLESLNALRRQEEEKISCKKNGAQKTNNKQREEHRLVMLLSVFRCCVWHERNLRIRCSGKLHSWRYGDRRGSRLAFGVSTHMHRSRMLSLPCAEMSTGTVYQVCTRRTRQSGMSGTTVTAFLVKFPHYCAS